MEADIILTVTLLYMIIWIIILSRQISSLRNDIYKLQDETDKIRSEAFGELRPRRRRLNYKK